MYLSATTSKAVWALAAAPARCCCWKGNNPAAALGTTTALTQSGRLLSTGGESSTAPASSPVLSASYAATATATATPPPHLPPVLPSPSAATQHAAAAPQKSAIGRLWDRYSIRGQQRRSQLAEAYFQAAARRASDPRWYGPGRVGREFRPRHALLTMHVWFLHKRLIHDTDDLDAALMVQEELFNILWDDTTSRIRQTGTSELLVNKHLMQVQQYTFLHLTHYDHAYTDFYLQRPLERMKELRNLVSHHIFRDPSMLATDPASTNNTDDPNVSGENSDFTSLSSSSSAISTDLLDRYAWYIEANYQNIMLHWPDEHYREGRVAWVNVPDFSLLKDSRGEMMPDIPVHPDDVLKSPWLTNITRRGVEYYWNPETRESRWERPT